MKRNPVLSSTVLFSRKGNPSSFLGGFLTTPGGRRIAVAFFARGGENRPAVIATAARLIYDAFGAEPSPNALVRMLGIQAASARLGKAIKRARAAID